MSNSITLKAYAKVNLFLEVLNKLPDGYHEIITVLHNINLADTIKVTTQKEGIKLTCNDSTLPTDSRNLAYRAAELFIKNQSLVNGFLIEIQKLIPIGAGLGGGSSDAANVLIGCNRLSRSNLPENKLIEMGKQLGMDVPFFLKGGTILALGRGEILDENFLLPDLNLVIVFPNQSISTKHIYQEIDNQPAFVKQNISSMRESLGSKNISKIAQNLFNRLEDTTSKILPEIKIIKNLLISAGCLNAIMSGSGSSVFGICDSYKKGNQIASHIHSLTGYWTYST